MAIKVTGNTTATSVASAKPRASVVVVDPVTSVSYSIAASSIAYVELGVSAELDTSGLFKFIPDSVVTTDQLVFSLSKPAQDSFSLADASTLLVDKALGDQVSFEDSLLVTLIFLRDFANQYDLSDELVLDIAKAAVDSVIVSDALALSLDKPFADVQALADAASIATAKALADSYSLDDAATLSYSKLVADASEMVDLIVFSIEKALNDSQPVIDDLAFSHSKELSDGFAMNDGFGATDGLDFSLSTTFSNVAFISDEATLSTAPAFADSVGVTDSGFILSQDYCDLTYFAQDYVGTAISF
jgi:hypothetical protein